MGTQMRSIVPAFIVVALVFIAPGAYGLTPTARVNKQNVIEFYDKAINQKDFEAASKYLGTRYTQHNPTVVDGQEGLKIFIEYLRDHYPDAHSEIKHIFAEDDYVILHVHSVRKPGIRGRAVFDLFKLENGKIVEHWDTVQNIPDHSANSNGMF
jgi:predicted SnoaL-like aldol condensation-catalyzing enzyme